MYSLLRVLIITVLAGILAEFGVAQTLDSLSQAEASMEKTWLEMPVTFRKVALVTEAKGFGIYKERPSADFKADEPMVVYAEPVGYAWKDNGDGTYSFGFAIDLLVKKPDGQIVAGQENFQKLELTSRAKNKEFMLTLTLNFTGAPPGDYVVEYTARDIASNKSGKFSIPIKITE